MKTFRHGDLTIKKVRKINGTKISHAGSFVLALGEATGHRHIITCEKPQAMMIYDVGDGRFMLNLGTLATLTHEEHKTITLVPGKYYVGREREYDWFALKTVRVQD